jgi:hypothetical protein
VRADTTHIDPHPELERARSDYLAVSRGGHLYATEADHMRAEAMAWERLEKARRAAEDAATDTGLEG